MGFNYYSFFLRGKERIFYTSVTLDDEKDILQWALRYNFIKENDIDECSNVRFLPPDEVEKRNRILYRKWWEEHKNDNSLCGKIPYTVGEVQLD